MRLAIKQDYRFRFLIEEDFRKKYAVELGLAPLFTKWQGDLCICQSILDKELKRVSKLHRKGICADTSKL